MKRLLHYLKVRRRAMRIKRLTTNEVGKLTKMVDDRKRELYTDDNDLGYC